MPELACACHAVGCADLKSGVPPGCTVSDPAVLCQVCKRCCADIGYRLLPVLGWQFTANEQNTGSESYERPTKEAQPPAKRLCRQQCPALARVPKVSKFPNKQATEAMEVLCERPHLAQSSEQAAVPSSGEGLKGPQTSQAMTALLKVLYERPYLAQSVYAGSSAQLWGGS